MSKVSKIVLASNNQGKLNEFSALFSASGLSVELIPQGQLGVSEAEEPFHTFVENALAKARHASAITGLAAIADDSGLCVTALGGAPGVQSARYAAMQGAGQGDEANNALLLQEMANQSNRRACFVSVLVYVSHPDDPRPIIAEGVWWGEIAQEAAGENGFGYDPLFLVPALGLHAAQLSPEQKNELSHRGQALRVLAERLMDVYENHE